MPSFNESFNVTRHNIKAPPSTAGGFSVGFQQDDFSHIIDGLSQAPNKIDKMVRNIAEVAAAEVVKAAKAYIGTGGPKVNTPDYSINGWPGLSPITLKTRKKNPNPGQILLDTGAMKGSIKAHVVGGHVTVSVTNWKGNYHEQGGDPRSSYMTSGRYKGNMKARPFLTPATYFVLNDPRFIKAMTNFIEENLDFAEFANARRFKQFAYKANVKTAAPKTVKYKDRKRKK